MKRENLLFGLMGLLLGFLIGYTAHETMTGRQPTRLAAGATPPPSAGPAANPMAGGQPAMAQVQQLRAHVEANPNDAAAVRQLANLNFDISNWRRAIDLYEHFLTLDPDNVEVMTDLGVCYRSAGDSQRALATFQRAIKARPGHWQARYNEVLVLAFDLGDLETAADAAVALQKAQPENPEVQRLIDEITKRRAAGT